jgi:hypothetical protein
MMFFYIESYHLLDYYYGNQNSCSFNIILHIFLWKAQKHNVRIWTTDIYKVAELRTPYKTNCESKTSLLTYNSCKILQVVDLVIFKIFPGLRLCEECYRMYVIFNHMTRVHIYLILYFIRIITKYIQLTTRHTDFK